MDLTHPGWPNPTETPRPRVAAGVLLAATCETLATAIVATGLAPRARDLGASMSTIGLLYTSLSIATLVAAPLLGFLSDRAGRRVALIASAACSLLGFACIAWGASEAFLFAGMILRGLGGARLGVEQAALGDGAGDRTHLRLLGALAVCGTFAWFAGPLAFGGLEQVSGGQGPMWAALGLTTLSITLVATLLPGRLPRGADDAVAMQTPGYRTSARGPDHAPPGSFSFALRPGAVLLLLAGLAGAVALVIFSASTSFDIYRRSDGDATRMAGVVTAMAVGPLVAQVAAIAGLAGALGPRRAALLSLAVAAAGIGLVLVGDGLLSTVVGTGLAQAASALWLLCLASMLAARAPREEGAALCTSQSLLAGAQVAGGMASGALLSTHAAAPGLTALLLVGVAAALVFLVARVESPAPEPTSSSPASPAS